MAKKEAEKAYSKAVKIAGSDKLLEAVRAFEASDKGRGEFCPYPATWLNQGRYEDDPSEWCDCESAGGRENPLLENETIEQKRERCLG